MRYLIDGYNLLHALGLLAGKAAPGELEQARRRLLGLLRKAHGERAVDVTVVFDAAGASRGTATAQEYRGIQVRFAHRQEADDLIKQYIRKESAPRGLTVVSDDHRIRQAARRRRCLVLGCGGYLDQIDPQRRPRPSGPDAPAKPEGSAPAETEHWLREFADLIDDPRLKELSDPPEFFENER